MATSYRDMWTAPARSFRLTGYGSLMTTGLIEIPPELTRYVIFKGSLSIEGVSLTIAQIDGMQVTTAIIPHTLEMTNLKSFKPGDPMNLEVDVIAKYVERMLHGGSANSAITLERLVSQGF